MKFKAALFLILILTNCSFKELETFESYPVNDNEILIYFDFSGEKPDRKLIDAKVRSHGASFPGRTKRITTHRGRATDQYEVFLIKSFDSVPTIEEFAEDIKPVIKSLRKYADFEFKIRRGIDPA